MRGAPEARCDLVFGGSGKNLNHDAGIRIDNQAPGRRSLSGKRFQRPRHVPGSHHLGLVRELGELFLPHSLPGYWAPTGAAVRKRTPSGTSPVLTKRHKAISSLRANATIMAMRVLPRPSLVRSRYHRTKALSFWKTRKR